MTQSTGEWYLLAAVEFPESDPVRGPPIAACRKFGERDGTNTWSQVDSELDLPSGARSAAGLKAECAHEFGIEAPTATAGAS